MPYDLSSIIQPTGKLDSAALPQLQVLVEKYPFYHAARIMMLRILYQEHDASFNEELHKAALFLPSRTKIYELIEGDKMRPKQREESAFRGAVQGRKSDEPVEHRRRKEDRTGQLLDMYLNGTPSVLMDTNSGRPVDATTDYMAYLLQQESKEGQTTTVSPDADSDDPISRFIKSQGDKRVQLAERPDSELQRPVIADQETAANQGAFTETLAKIYIKQGKFEQAIEIIKRLSLKYPKKNRYFADQIRFLEKLIMLQQGQKKEKN